jgi:hypothetical protein
MDSPAFIPLTESLISFRSAGSRMIATSESHTERLVRRLEPFLPRECLVGDIWDCMLCRAKIKI